MPADVPHAIERGFVWTYICDCAWVNPELHEGVKRYAVTVML
jgi:hypothetical protein